MLKRWSIILSVLVLSLVFIHHRVTEAQFDATCAPLVSEALDAIGDNCGGLGRNSACYGFNRVGATFATEQSDEFFSRPADLALLSDLRTLNTAPLDIQRSEWGIAVLNVQADLPDSLPGQSVTFLLFGDVTLENAVDSEAAQPAARTVAATTTAQTVMRTRPTVTANTSALVPPGTLLEADRVSDDGEWLRVVYENLVGWVRQDTLEADGDLDTLPTPDSAPYTPMQAVRLNTNVTGFSCAEAPPSLLVMQGPQQMTVSINVNGAELSIGSTIAVWTVGGQMLLAVIDGGVYTEDGLYIPAGTITSVTLDDSGRIVLPWAEPRPLTLDEWRQFEPLENVPPNLLKYPIEVPSEIISSIVPTATPRPAAPVVIPPANPPQVIQVDCGAFRATSPLDGLPFGGTTFYWDGVASPAITGYRVSVFRDGSLAASFDAPPSVTRVDGDLSGLPLGGSYTWEVQALVNGVAVCQARSGAPIQRSFPPAQPPPAPAATEETRPQYPCEIPSECRIN